MFERVVPLKTQCMFDFDNFYPFKKLMNCNIEADSVEVDL